MGARNLEPMLSSDNSTWGTPGDFFGAVHHYLRFTIDVCADRKNRKLRRFYDERQDGLRQRWGGETWWCNPPYSDQLPRWTGKGRWETLEHPGTAGALLVPSRVDTDWWIATVEQAAGKLRRSYWHQPSRVLWLQWAGLRVGVYHHDQRLKFEGCVTKSGKPTGAPFPSSLIILAHPTWRAPNVLPLEGAPVPPLTAGMPT